MILLRLVSSPRRLSLQARTSLSAVTIERTRTRRASHVCSLSDAPTCTSSGQGRALRDVTPLVAQYLARKREYPDCMLLFQVGDFYEFFGADARRAAHLALTTRSKRTPDDALRDMCGFPVGSVHAFVEKLTCVCVCHVLTEDYAVGDASWCESGHLQSSRGGACVCVGSSASSAKKRGYKALVDRQVVRIVTPGSLVEDTLLTPRENHYLAALYYENGRWGLAWADVSTGEFVSTTATSDKLASAILRCSPREILLPSWMDPASNRSDHGVPPETMKLLDTSLPDSCMKTFRPLTSFVAPRDGTKKQHEASLKTLDVPEQAAIAAILDYVHFTHQGVQSSTLIQAPLHVESSDHMIIDASAWKGLELGKSLRGYKTASLLQTIDATVTPGGSRLLATHLASPLLNLKLLEDRLDAVSFFYEQEPLLHRIRKQLAEIFDMERNLQRLSIGMGTPKDLKNVASTIDHVHSFVEGLETSKRVRSKQLPDLPGKHSVGLPPLLQDCCNRLVARKEKREKILQAAATIHAALKDDYTSLNAKTGFIKAGYSSDLDQWQALVRHDSKASEHHKLQLKYRALIGSKRLRVVFQAEKGYFLDLPHDEHTRLLQTDRGRLALEQLTLFQSRKKSVRYRSDELRELNRQHIEAAVEVERLEKNLFDALRAQVLDVREDLQAMAQALSQLDVICSHAQVALDRNFTRPLLDATCELHIEDGRHAVVEAAHHRGVTSRGLRAFVPNSLHLGAAPSASCWLVTGPNMGGKSTFLRQTAHVVLLAQMGSFVPASFARVGLVDKLFCRVGSADELAADKSTFLVEMHETSTILTHATRRSLVVMDEVGRGTAVNDGMAIAGAVLEALCARDTRTLFATHFTALCALVGETCHGNLRPYRMEVIEQQGPDETTQLVFTHRVVQGLASHSYGLHTAALAGVPPSVLARAADLLRHLTHETDK
ncbi:hypothetical protein PsorP6_011974 [Peronosclerospora sorghi]|uniref:Uncharacterized protein n=1 Tax=Peronosclerospora sorghi TaxID=230839 RepID=A0ACC0WLS8_9STRA|nr:hypothetical protein PsorP6_011974 [Peronosclerospora sorghi]